MEFKTKLLILGAGGHGHVVAESVTAAKPSIEIVFLDDRKNEHDSLWPIIGTFKMCFDIGIRNLCSHAICGIGDTKSRIQWNKELHEIGYNIPKIIHPHAWVSPSASIGRGTLIGAGVIVNARSIIGDSVILNTSCSVDHDCRIGDGVHVAPGAHLAGGVDIQRNTFIGTGSSIIPNIVIGSNVTVGAGTVIINNIPDNVTAIGTPAKIKSIKQR